MGLAKRYYELFEVILLDRIKVRFERGGELIINLNDKAPNTVQHVLNALPLESKVMHTRWCGREFSFALNSLAKMVKENNSGTVSKFDVAYWRNWGNDETLIEAPGYDAISIYYGAERLSYHGGLLSVNVFGRVDWQQEDMLEQIGLRIWEFGFEKVYACITSSK
jgi:hypothetical protein